MTNINTFQGDVFIHEYIKHTGDDNNLFGFSGTDTFKIATAGVDRLTVNSAGTVTLGVNMAIPNYIWHAGGGNNLFGFSGAHTFKIMTSGADRLTVAANGTVTVAGTLTAGGFSGSDISTGTVAAARVATLNQNTTGSAATLTTARNIGGVSFNGSAAINLPGVNTAGNQATSGLAATATKVQVTRDDTGDTAMYLVMAPDATAGQKDLYMDNGLIYDNTNNRLRLAEVMFGDQNVYGLGAVTGSYGSVQTLGTGKGSYEGYNINAQWVFMSNGAAVAGIYNDTDGEWMTKWNQNGSTDLYYNGANRLQTTNTGVHVTGDVYADHMYIDDYLYHNGDDNTRIGFGTDTIYMRTAGTDRLTVSSAGNVTLSNSLYIPGYIYHVGDNNTYMGFSAADTIVMRTAGTNRLTVNSSGNVTLNNSLYIPNYIYHVGDTNTYMGFSGNDTIVMRTAGTNRLTVNSAGNVGIGLSSPSYSLEIQNSGGTHLAVYRPASNVPFGASIDYILHNNSNDRRIYGRMGASIQSNSTNNEYGFLSFQVRMAGALDNNYSQQKLRVDNTGIKVWGGIGFDGGAPTCKLDCGNSVLNRVLSIYAGSSNSTSSTGYYGFGVNPSVLRYNVGSAGDTHVFFGSTTQFGYINNTPGFVNSFTGQHKSFPHESLSGKTVDELSGLIVCASGEHISVNDAIPQRGQDGITVSEAIPSVKLSLTENEKTVFGVVSNVEDPESTKREDRSGAFTSTFIKLAGDTRIYVNSIGEGAVWVVNTNGSFVNGDYITTSNVAGYGQKQASDSLKNYTVAKITMDCDFVGTTAPKKRIKKKTITETLEETVEETVEDNMPEDVYTYDVDRECYVKTVKDNIKTQTRSVMQEYELRDSDGNVITEPAPNTITIEQYEALENKEGCVANNDENTGIIQDYTQTINKPVVYSGNKIVVNTVTHEVDDLDEHGQIQWEDHPTETEKAYKIRYLDANGVITDEANIVHTAAFVGCTYHCG